MIQDQRELIFNHLLKDENTIVVELSSEGNIIDCSDTFTLMFGLTQKPSGKHFTLYLRPESQSLLPLTEHDSGRRFIIDFSFSSPTGHSYTASCLKAGESYILVCSRVNFSESEILGRLSRMNMEVTNLSRELNAEVAVRKKTEKALRVTIKEKETLVKEVYHRVKNNLAVIESLLNLQSSSAEDEKSRVLLKESQSRVRAMAMIHERLYKSDSLKNINFSEYVKNLTHEIFRNYRTGSAAVELKTSVTNVEMDIDRLIPFGLVINELVTNSLKYAFRKKKQGAISLILEPFDNIRFCLIIKDDGQGLPDGFDPQKSGSLGMKLISSLVSQIGGELEIHPVKPSGAEFRVLFEPDNQNG